MVSLYVGLTKRDTNYRSFTFLKYGVGGIESEKSRYGLLNWALEILKGVWNFFKQKDAYILSTLGYLTGPLDASTAQYRCATLQTQVGHMMPPMPRWLECDQIIIIIIYSQPIYVCIVYLGCITGFATGVILEQITNKLFLFMIYVKMKQS